MNLQMSSEKWRPFCLGLHVLKNHVYNRHFGDDMIASNKILIQLPLILEIDCGPPVLIPDSILVSEGTLFGNVSTYTSTGPRRVEDGQRVVVAVCGEDWGWSEQQITCQGEWHRSHRNYMLGIALAL